MTDCIFCKIIKGELPSYKVYEDENVYAFFDINPVNKYHTLVIPKKHHQDFLDIPVDTLKDVMAVTQKIAKIYEQKLGIKNMQIINSCGAEGQQEVFHIHFHIVPRHEGDGQNIKWNPRLELREEMADLLKALN